jgi:cobalamin biosynthesis protein CobT
VPSFGKSKVRLWESTLEKLARILADKYKIKVIFKGDLCCTTGKDIYLPVIPEGASDEFLDAVAGYLDHEVSHNIFTEMEIIKETCALGVKHTALTNIIEDHRVEKEMIKLWRGSKINLRNCREWSLKQLSAHWSELSEFGKLGQSIGICAVCDPTHWFVEKHISSDPELLQKLETVKEYTDLIPSLSSTREAFELAKSIMMKLQEEDVPEPSEEEEVEEDSKESSVSAGELTGDEKFTSLPGQIQKEAKALQEDRIKRNLKEDRYLIYSTEDDVIEYITDGDKTALASFLAESRQMVNTIRQKFRLNLVGCTKNRWECGKRRGKIDHQSVYKVVLGTGKDVFRTKMEAPGFDTAVSLYIDHSSSMSFDKINLAAMSAIIFGEALNDIGIPFEIAGYSTGQYDEGVNIFNQASEEERKLYTRWGRLWIGVYKRFDELWLTSRHRCLNMSRHEKYNTYDGEAVRFAAQRLLARPEKRKILFVFSDGYPCPNVQQFTDDHCAYLTTIAKDVEKVVELFAIGIKSDSVKKYYKNSVVVNDIRDLPSVMLSQLDRMIRQGQNILHKAS